MTILSQKSPKWRNEKLGTSTETFGSAGCFLFSLCIMYDLDPIETNKLLTENGGFINGNLMNSERAAALLGVQYEGKTREYQNKPCIAETDNFRASGYPQHFFVWLGDGQIIDPIDGQQKTNKYNIVSFRLFREKDKCEVKMPNEEFKEIAWNVVNGFYLNFYKRQATAKDIDAHINWIMNYSPRKWALSEWVNRQPKEKEFTDKWGKSDCSIYIKKIENAKKALS